LNPEKKGKMGQFHQVLKDAPRFYLFYKLLTDLETIVPTLGKEETGG